MSERSMPQPSEQPRAPGSKSQEGRAEDTVSLPSGQPAKAADASVFEPLLTPVPEHDLTQDHLLLKAPRLGTDGRAVPALGGILLMAKLGQGGMGAVYRGFHPRLGKEVAVKVLPAHLADSRPDLKRRFVREAQLAAGIHSPHLVGVIDVNEENGIFYFVQEFVRGVSAGDYLDERQAAGQAALDERMALAVAAAAATGLATAHAQGVIHRDIKPDNILLPRNAAGQLIAEAAKLADLGLAHQEQQGRSITASSDVLGTPGYLAPEQALDARTITKAVDVFAMGATLYKLVTGRSPFLGETPVAAIMATINAPHTPARVLRPDLSEATNECIELCLAKDPNERFADGSSLLDALRKCQEALGQPRHVQQSAISALRGLVKAPEHGAPLRRATGSDSALPAAKPRSTSPAPADSPQRSRTIVLAVLGAAALLLLVFGGGVLMIGLSLFGTSAPNPGKSAERPPAKPNPPAPVPAEVEQPTRKPDVGVQDQEARRLAERVAREQELARLKARLDHAERLVAELPAKALEELDEAETQRRALAGRVPEASGELYRRLQQLRGQAERRRQEMLKPPADAAKTEPPKEVQAPPKEIVEAPRPQIKPKPVAQPAPPPLPDWPKLQPIEVSRERDPAGRAYTLVRTQAVVRQDLGKGLWQLACPPGGGELYAIYRESQEVRVFDPGTFEPRASIQAPKNPVSLWCDASRIVVACPESKVVTFVDAAARRPIRSVPIPSDHLKPYRVLGRHAEGGVLVICKPKERASAHETSLWLVAEEGEAKAIFERPQERGFFLDDGRWFAQHGFRGSPSGRPEIVEAGKRTTDYLRENKLFGPDTNWHRGFAHCFRTADRRHIVLPTNHQETNEPWTYVAGNDLQRLVFDFPGAAIAELPGEEIFVSWGYERDGRRRSLAMLWFAARSNGRILRKIVIEKYDPHPALYVTVNADPSALFVPKHELFLHLDPNDFQGTRGVAVIRCGPVEENLAERGEPALFVENNPPAKAKVGAPLEFLPRFAKPEAARGATFRLMRGPQEIKLDPASGRLTWTPSAAYVGKFDLAIVAEFEGGAEVPVVAWTIEVEP